jgi:hypothetical protein
MGEKNKNLKSANCKDMCNENEMQKCSPKLGCEYKDKNKKPC